MTEAVNFAASTVAVSEFAGRAVSGLRGRLNKHAATDEKLQRLELLLIKIHSVITASEQHEVENTWLLRWREKLKKAASEGDQVLAVFTERLGRQQDGAAGACSSSSSISPPAAAAAASTSTLSFTRKALSGMVQGIRSATNMIFFTDEDTKKLDSAVDKLEKLFPDIWEFIRLLQLEIMPKIQHIRPKKRKRPPPQPVLQMEPETVELNLGGLDLGQFQWFRSGSAPENQEQIRRRLEKEERMRRIKEATWHEIIMSETHGLPRRPVEAWIAETPEYKEYQLWTALQRRLMQAMCRISWAVTMAADRDLDDSGGLAQWAAVLKQAHLQGRLAEIDVNRSLSKYSSFNDGELALLAALSAYGTNEVDSLVRSLEILAGDVECFGSLLVALSMGPRNSFTRLLSAGSVSIFSRPFLEFLFLRHYM